MDTVFAITDLAGGIGACVANALEFFVGLSVAVVVLVITSLCAWFFEAFTRRESTVYALALSWLTNARLSCFASLSCSIDALGLIGWRLFAEGFFGCGLDRNDDLRLDPLVGILGDGHISFTATEKSSGKKKRTQQSIKKKTSPSHGSPLGAGWLDHQI
ncbi:MAG: DNA translocase FtsK 4TM domain-containing protein [Myxococcales bacterium]|nr:DNA translocase FtsK 4TM domain-containing protein [Myxococcales bacterium]